LVNAAEAERFAWNAEKRAILIRGTIRIAEIAGS